MGEPNYFVVVVYCIYDVVYPLQIYIVFVVPATRVTIHKERLPTLGEILSLRVDRSAYTFFCDHLLGAVTGMKKFAKASRSRWISNIATISDEAFALVLLENNYEVWVDMQTRGVTKGSSVDPKYTNGGNSVGNGRSRKYKGWSDEGIERYNELFDRVKKDRENNTFFDRYYMEKRYEEWEEAGGNKRKRKREIENSPIPSKARHELWDEEVEEDQEAAGENKNEESESSDSSSSKSSDDETVDKPQKTKKGDRKRDRKICQL